MPKRLRLTRRFPVALTNDAHRKLGQFATEAGITQDEALTFLFEHFNSVIDQTNSATAAVTFGSPDCPHRSST